MTETVAIFAVLGVLMSIGWAAFQAVENGATAQRTRTELVQVASSAAAWELSRGYFPDVTELVELEPQFTFVGANPSQRLGEYSSAIATDSGSDVLGLAAITEDGTCYTLTQPPLDVDSIVVNRWKFTPTPSLPCRGDVAFQSVGDSW